MEKCLEHVRLSQSFERRLKGPRPGETLRSVTLNIPPSVLPEKRRTNKVISSKYTPWTFLPFAIAIQFKRGVNMFYLCVAILLIVGNYANNVFSPPFDAGGTIVLLAIVVGFGMILEGTNDFLRHRGDWETNGTQVKKIRLDGSCETVCWGELIPGDLILINKDDQVAADILILAALSPETRQICYIETSGIDGETNLKMKEVPPFFVKPVLDEFPLNGNSLRLEDVNKIGSIVAEKCQGSYEYEEPNSFLQFNGVFNSDRKDQVAVDFTNLVLRGSNIRNTQHVIGMVMYAGAETKLVLSNEMSSGKFSRMDQSINGLLIAVLGLYFIMVIIATLLLFTGPDTDQFWYLDYMDVTQGYLVPGWLAFLFTNLVLFSSTVPIPMVIIADVINFACSYYIVNDLEMYHEETDTAAGARNAQLVTDLGMVTHVFSDKTGTLTRNEMKLVGCYVDGQTYGVPPESRVEIQTEVAIESPVEIQTEVVIETPDLDKATLFQDVIDLLKSSQSGQDRIRVLDFFVFLATCHTTLVQEDPKTGNQSFNSESPDEEAFVKAAADVGVSLINTQNGMYTVSLMMDGTTLKYSVLALNAFNSTRKRMSVVFSREMLDGETETIVLVKGADNMMMSRLSINQSEKEKLDRVLVQYSWAGLRTLVMGKRVLNPNELAAFMEKVHTSSLLKGEEKEKGLEEAAELIESNLDLVGASAIEDRLQEGVPEAIETLRGCGVQVYVLTGDKVETAINIGLASRLLNDEMFQIKLTNADNAGTELERVLQMLDTSAHIAVQSHLVKEKVNETADCPEEETEQQLFESGCLALIVSGDALEVLLKSQKGNVESELMLLKLTRMCKVVLACRVSPSQKSLIVKMVKYAVGTKPMTLAIGDGANDVPMIQSAHIGIGISGHEGRQAVNNSDFSIAQFRFLVDLMLVHGRWNYRRMSKLVIYVSYSWILYTLLLFLYGAYTLWSGTQVYAVYIFTVVTAYFANIAVCVHGFFDRDLGRQTVKENPWIYKVGLKSLDLNWKRQFQNLVKGLVHTAIIWSLVLNALPAKVGYDSLGVVLYNSVLMVLWYEQLRCGSTYTAYSLILFVIMFVAYAVLMVFVVPENAAICNEAGCDFSVGFVVAYVIVILFAIVCLQDAFFYFAKEFYPSRTEILQEIDQGYSKYTIAKDYKGAGGVVKEAGKIIRDAGPKGYQKFRDIFKEVLLERIKETESLTTLREETLTVMRLPEMVQESADIISELESFPQNLPAALDTKLTLMSIGKVKKEMNPGLISRARLQFIAEFDEDLV